MWLSSKYCNLFIILLLIICGCFVFCLSKFILGCTFFLQPSRKVRRPLRPSLSGPFEELNAENAVMCGRRVKSGPNKCIPPVVDSVTRVKSGPPERSVPAGISSEQTVGQTSPNAGKARKKGGEKGGSGDKGRKKSQSEEDKPKDELVSYYEEHVKPLLSQMEERFAERNVKDLCQDCLKLWNALEKKGLMGKASGSFSARKRRGEILRTVFNFLDLSDPRLLLRLGRLILSVSI